MANLLREVKGGGRRRGMKGKGEGGAESSPDWHPTLAGQPTLLELPHEGRDA